LSCLAIAVLSLESGYVVILMELSQFQALGCQKVFPDPALPQKIPFMPTLLSQLQAQGWKKWLSRITFTRRTNYLKSLPMGRMLRLLLGVT